jgi:hypothetical protein
MAAERRQQSETDRSTADERARPADEKIRDRAYEIFEERGGEQGHDWDDSLQAERELRPRREDE